MTVERLVSEAARIVRKDLTRSRMVPALVVAADQTGELPMPAVTVQVDGDPPGTYTTVSSLLPTPPTPGSRVMVMFDPPHAAYVVGHAGIAGNAGCGPLEQSFSREGGLTLTESQPWQAGDFNRTLYRAKMIFRVVDTADVTVEVRRNGDVVTALTMPAGECFVEDSGLAANFGVDGEHLTVCCTDLGDSEARGVTVTCYLSCHGVDGDHDCDGGGGGV